MCTWWTAYQLFPLLMDDQVSYFPRRRHVPWVWGVHTHLEELMNTWIKWLCWMNCRLIKVICLLIFMQSPGPQNRRTRRTCAGDQASLGGPKSWWTRKLTSFESWGNQSVELTKQWRGQQNWICNGKLSVSNWQCHKIPIFVVCCICRNSRVFGTLLLTIGNQ